MLLAVIAKDDKCPNRNAGLCSIEDEGGDDIQQTCPAVDMNAHGAHVDYLNHQRNNVYNS